MSNLGLNNPFSEAPLPLWLKPSGFIPPEGVRRRAGCPDVNQRVMQSRCNRRRRCLMILSVHSELPGTFERFLVPLRMPRAAFRARVPHSCFLCMDLQVSPHQNSWSLFCRPSANSYTYPLYLPLYAVRLPLPGLARFHLTYFFSILTICLIYTNSSALLSVFFPFWCLSLVLWWIPSEFFFFCSPTHPHLPKCLWLKILT